jgi:high-affinity iron transporter
MSSVFIEAVVILLREGLEALLVIAALAAYLTKSGAQDRLPALYSGAGAAIVASLVAAWVFAVFNNGQHNDIMEAGVILAAAALMLYVSGWLLVRQDPRAWQAYLQQRAGAALAKRTAVAVGMLAFLAVFREGAETVLFIHALANTAGGWDAALVAGLVAGAGGLVILFFVINGLARRLPLRPLFIATSALLFVMALRFIGAAIQEFQEQLLIPYDPIAGATWLTTLGFNPTWEAIAVQGAVLVLAIRTCTAWWRSTTRATVSGGRH